MAANYPESFERLIELLKGLPGIGRRSAERLAFAMLQWPNDRLQAMGETIRSIPETITPCPECGNLSEQKEICPICKNSNRDHSIICVVEDAIQIRGLEESGQFRGLYHVLGGRLAPLSGKGIHDLDTDKLIARIEKLSVEEVILAFSPDVEGQATAIYLSEILRREKMKVSCLARGLPAGADLSYVDAATIGAALSGRTQI